MWSEHDVRGLNTKAPNTKHLSSKPVLASSWFFQEPPRLGQELGFFFFFSGSPVMEDPLVLGWGNIFKN
jgi:hypothetical protein